jgi:hypothetical protein
MYFHNKLILNHKCEYYLLEIWSNVKHFNWYAYYSFILSIVFGRRDGDGEDERLFFIR